MDTHSQDRPPEGLVDSDWIGMAVPNQAMPSEAAVAVREFIGQHAPSPTGP